MLVEVGKGEVQGETDISCNFVSMRGRSETYSFRDAQDESNDLHVVDLISSLYSQICAIDLLHT
jgi:hypothetical protein